MAANRLTAESSNPDPPAGARGAPPHSGREEPWLDFAHALCGALGLRLQAHSGRFAALPPEPAAASARQGDASQRRVLGRRARQGDGLDHAAGERLEADTPAGLLAALRDGLASRQRLAGFIPADDPQAVHELADRLFDAYTIDGGAIHLAGCHLEPVPMLRLSTLDPSRGCVLHRYFTESGAPADDRLRRERGLHQTVAAAPPLDTVDRRPWRPAIAAAIGADGLHATADDALPAIASLVFTNEARVRLVIEIGEESLEVNLRGWARTLEAIPARCPQTGTRSFHFAATGDGRMAAAEQIVVCEESGYRLLVGETARCVVTGRRADRRLLETCPVSDAPVLAAGLAACGRCGERVAKTALSGGGCVGCNGLAAVAEADGRLSAVRAAAPRLARAEAWRLAETASVLVAQTGGLFRRVLVVVDKQTGEPRQASVRHLAGRWRVLPAAERRLLLGR